MRPSARNLKTLPIGIHCLDRGLYLRVTSKGRYWIFKYQLNNKRKEIGLGGIDQPIIAVQGKAAKLRAYVANGLDPRTSVGPRKAILVSDITQEALEHIIYVRQLGKSRQLVWKRIFKRIEKAWGTRRLTSISPQDVLDFLKTIWSSQPGNAKDTLIVCKGFFDYALGRNLIGSNPAIWEKNLELHLPSHAQVRKTHPIKHYKALDAEVLRTYVHELETRRTACSRAILTIILTACRKSEILLLKWEEVDWKNRILKIPTERRKDRKGEPFLVPLSDQAFDLLKSIEPVKGNPYVFAGRKTCLSSYTLVSSFSLLTGATLHGCRSTFSDWCAKNNKNFLVAEKCLMHSVGNQVFRAYQRDDLLEQRRILLQEWADYLHS